MVTWGPGTAAGIEAGIDTESRVPRVPLSAIFRPALQVRDGLSRRTPLRGVVNGDGE